MHWYDILAVSAWGGVWLMVLGHVALQWWRGELPPSDPEDLERHSGDW